ncbi:glycoside hydrolase, partial [Hungatella sp. SL.1.14]|nr:glycoside hydrolase [Hungatella sp. SL.1.14]
MYYIFLISCPPAPLHSGRRIELCYRSDRIDGVYEGRVVLDSDMGFHNMGVAQGGIFVTAGGEWYSLLFQDHGSTGRIPVLVPVTWEDGWPVFG